MTARLVLLAAVAIAARAQSAPGPELRDAVAALERSDFKSAEPKLRAEIAKHPNNAWALSLLGAALDSLHRSPEAAPLHRRAATLAPRSAPILANAAAHFLLAGDAAEASKLYERVVALDPAHRDANLQLTRIALDRDRAAEAVAHLERLPSDPDPRIDLLRLEALYRAGDQPRATPILLRLTEAARDDANLTVALALAVLRVPSRAPQAASILEAGLRKWPADFVILYNLGVAATRAGSYDRARSALEAALRQQPQNVDVLYALANAENASRHPEAAAQLLARAARLDPKRPDVQNLLAIVTGDLGALDDSLAAWNRYVQLRPDDPYGRRERGYTLVQMGRVEEGLPDLEWAVAKFPNHPTGHYELGQAERTRNLARALAEFDRALALEPKYVPALAARAAIHNQQGEPEKALPDLEAAAAIAPHDAGVLDRLGQTYAALDRPADALRILRRAAELAPENSKTLLHLARALADSGATEQSKQVMDRFRRLGPEKKSGVPAGFVEYLSMSDAQRRAAYRARLDKALREHPGDPALQLDRLKLLLSDGRATEAIAMARALPAASQADAGRALLAARQYAAAAELLPAGPERTVAERLAAGAVEEAIAAAPDRPEVYRDAAAILAARNRFADAVRVLDRAPKSRDVLLQRSVAAELAGDPHTADEGLAALRAQSPEWAPAWAAQGMILARRKNFAEARQALETALALGAAGPEVYYYVALTAADPRTARAAIDQAARLAPADPWIQALAAHGKSPAEDPPYLQRLFR